ncbi:MAG: phosphate ABC transporter permease PstA [Rhodoluna sp.]|nr:phosphate ABC transporter permease PstA [Rhodoluna sp.]
MQIGGCELTPIKKSKNEPTDSKVKESIDEFEERRAVKGLRVRDWLYFLGAGLGAVSSTAFLFGQILPFSGAIPFVLISYVLFLVYFAILVSLDDNGQAVADRMVSITVNSLALLVFVTLVFIVVFTVGRGSTALANWNFISQDMSLAGPLDPLTDGGITHAIVGSLTQIAIALAVTVPLGLITAVYLNEIQSKLSRFVRTIVEAMTALPSIVAGLFIYATAILVLGIQKSGLAAALAISVMMLPIMIRASDVVLRLVPSTLKEASLGLGASNFKTTMMVTLPTARSGLTTAIILATARGVGETSPVLLTSGFTAALNLDPLQGPMISLPLAIFEFVKSPEPTMIARGFGTAAVLMLLVLVLFALARLLGSNARPFHQLRIQLNKLVRIIKTFTATLKKEAK